MQVIQKSGEGLSRVYGVTVGAAELGAKLEARIAEIAPQMRLKGFRPGKVPPAHVRRVYGKALMGEVVEQTLNETTQQVLTDNGLRVAAQPDLQPQSDMEQVIAGKVDLAYDLNVEVMPEFEPMDVFSLKLERPVYTPSQAELDEALADLARQSRTYEMRTGKDAAARDADQVVIDFVGKIDGEAFEGGTAEDAQLVLGSGQFIPGFEEQLVGAKAGDEKTIAVRFPDDYSVERLKGKDAEFAVEVKEVRAPKEAAADDALAERLGMGDLEALQNAVRVNLENQYGQTTRFKLKRALLDQLDAGHDFPLPPRMVESEFNGIWTQVEADRAKGELAPEDEGKTEEQLKGEYRKIAERRVRLGLVLAEIGRRNNVEVSDAEVTDAMRQEALRFGAQAQAVFDMLRANTNAQATLRAPIYEEKVVDLILDRATVTDKQVSKEELLAEDELPEGYGEAAKPKAKAKGAKATKAKAEPEAPAPAKAPSKAKAAKAAPAKADAEPAKPAKAKAGAEGAAAPKAAKAKAKSK